MMDDDEIKIGVLDLQSEDAIRKKIKQIRSSKLSNERQGQLLSRCYEHLTRRFPLSVKKTGHKLTGVR